jgi:hypothetical protein
MPIPTTLQSEQAECVEVAGSFDTTTSTTDPSAVRGVGFSVTKDSDPGVYTVAFDNPYHELISFTCSIQRSAATVDIYASAGDYTAASGSTGATQVIHTTAGAAAPVLADPTADPDSRVHFKATFRRFSGI